MKPVTTRTELLAPAGSPEALEAAVAAGANAGKIVGAAAQLTGGKGGGRPDSAMAGVKDISKLSDALAALPEIVGGLVK